MNIQEIISLLKTARCIILPVCKGANQAHIAFTIMPTTGSGKIGMLCPGLNLVFQLGSFSGSMAFRNDFAVLLAHELSNASLKMLGH